MKYIFNGTVHEAENILLPLENNGAFMYGDGFFESGRMIDGKWKWKEYHWERITRSCELLKMKNPVSSADELEQGIRSIAGPLYNSRIRISFWRNSLGGYMPETSTHYLIQLTPMEEVAYPLNEKGLDMCMYRELYKSISPLSNLKSLSSQLCVMATLFAQEQCKDESILLNSGGDICETNRSNIWLVKNNRVQTPPLSDGCLDGVMRRVVKDLLLRCGYLLEEKTIREQDLFNADEVFISGSVRGIQWVHSIDERVYEQHTVSGRISAELHQCINS